MLEVCTKQNIFFAFIDWYFHQATLFLLRAWKNFLLFGLHYFSVGELCRTFFSHWHRISDTYGRGFDIQRYITTFLGNLMSRALGALVRLVVIIIGLLFELFIVIAGVIVILLWVLLPIWLTVVLLAGIGLLL